MEFHEKFHGIPWNSVNRRNLMEFGFDREVIWRFTRKLSPLFVSTVPLVLLTINTIWPKSLLCLFWRAAHFVMFSCCSVLPEENLIKSKMCPDYTSVLALFSTLFCVQVWNSAAQEWGWTADTLPSACIAPSLWLSGSFQKRLDSAIS
jgi:hypothetical protein